MKQSWCGWVRSPGRPWRRVCQADTEEAAWLLLLDHRVLGAHAERLVLPAGQGPGDRRPRRSTR